MSTPKDSSVEKDDNQGIRTSLVDIGKENICAFFAGYVLASLPLESLFLI